METFDNGTPATIKSLLAAFAADIDIFLLRENDQKTDKEKTYTKEEIREQLVKTLEKFADLPLNYDAQVFLLPNAFKKKYKSFKL